MKNSENVLFLFNRAEFNLRDNNLPEAIKLFTEGIKQYTNLSSYDFDFHLENCYLGRCYSYLELGENEKALKDCAEIVKHNLNNPDAWLYYGIASFRLKNYRESLEYLNYSKELSQDSTVALTWIANVNFEIEEYQEALLNVNKALQRNPTDQWASELSQKIATKMSRGKEGEDGDISVGLVLHIDTGEYVPVSALPLGRYQVYEYDAIRTTINWDGSIYAASQLKMAADKDNWGLKSMDAPKMNNQNPNANQYELVSKNSVVDYDEEQEEDYEEEYEEDEDEEGYSIDDADEYGLVNLDGEYVDVFTHEKYNPSEAADFRERSDREDGILSDDDFRD